MPEALALSKLGNRTTGTPTVNLVMNSVLMQRLETETEANRKHEEHSCQHSQLSFSIIRLFLPKPASSDGEEKNKLHQKIAQWGLNPGPLDHNANALLTEVSQHLVASHNLHGLCKVMFY